MSGAYHHGDLAGAAAEAALALVREGGEASLSLRKVADRAGVTHRAVYNHYDGRDALLRAVAVQGWDALLCAVEATRDRRGFVAAYLRFALDEPHLYAVTVARTDERWSDPRLRAAALALVDAAKARVGGGDDAVKRLWMTLHGGLSLHWAGALQPRSDDKLIAMMTELTDG